MSYTSNDELSIISYILKNPSALKTYGNSLAEHHFVYRPAALLYKSLAEILAKQSDSPTLTEFARELNKKLTPEKVSVAERNIYLDALAEVYCLPTTELTGQLLHTFHVNREYELLLEKMNLMDPAEVEKNGPDLKRRIDLISQSRSSMNNKCISLFSETGIKLTAESVVNQQTGKTSVPLGWPLLDDLLAGGVYQGELIVVMAPTGVGKTLTLFNIATNIYQTGRRVLYFILDNLLGDFAERVHAVACGIPIPEKHERLERTEAEYIEMLRTSLPGGEFNDRFLIKIWSPSRHKASEIKLVLEEVKLDYYESDVARGVPPDKAGKCDVVVFDYAALCKPEEDNERNDLAVASTLNEMSAVAKEEQIPIFTGLQTQRSAAGQHNLKITNAAESWAQLFCIAILIGVSQDDAERILSELRFEILKCRRLDATGKYIRMKINQRLQKLTEDPEMAEPGYCAESAQPTKSREDKLAQILKRQEALPDIDNFDPLSFNINPDRVKANQRRLYESGDDYDG